jgi:hypothetical protein
MSRGSYLLSAPLLFAVSVTFSRGDVPRSPMVDTILRRRSELSTSEAASRAAVQHSIGFQVSTWKTTATSKLPCLCSNSRRTSAPTLIRKERSVRMNRESEFDRQVSGFHFQLSCSQTDRCINTGRGWFGTSSENSGRKLKSKAELRGQSRSHSRRLDQV